MLLSIKEQQEVVLETLDFARTLARKFHLSRAKCGFDLDEFESAAFLGLCDSARRYDKDSEVTFKGFAFLRIQGEMHDLLRSGGLTTRKQVRALANLFGEKARPENLKRLFRNLRVDLKFFGDIVSEAGIRLHFNNKNQVSDISYVDAQNPEELLSDKNITQFLRKLVARLPDKERLVIELRYFEDLTFEEMRDQFRGATRSWLCRIHGRALDHLRDLLVQSENECNKLEKVA